MRNTFCIIVAVFGFTVATAEPYLGNIMLAEDISMILLSKDAKNVLSPEMVGMYGAFKGIVHLYDGPGSQGASYFEMQFRKASGEYCKAAVQMNTVTKGVIIGQPECNAK